MRRAVVLLALLAWSGQLRAEPLLASYKDELFAYPEILETAQGGRYVTYDYREMRDINGRDEIPERRAHARYVDSAPRATQADLVTRTAAGPARHVRVGRDADARFILLYVHGQGGDRRQGMDDFSFGGNFNRVKNLAHRNDGLYLTMDVADFGRKGARQAASLMRIYADHSPGARLFVACGSAGGVICWHLAESDLADRLGGILLLGSFAHDGFRNTAAFAARVPLFIAHGGNDGVFPVAAMEALMRSILAAAPDYPIRLARFATGSHGTPMRMTDWRETLNWMVVAAR